jgi:hypothetical protein
MTDQCIPLIYTKGMGEIFPNVFQRVDKYIQTNEEWQKLMQGQPLNSRLVQEAVEQEFMRHGEEWPLIQQGRPYWNAQIDMRDPDFFTKIRKTDEKLLLMATSWLSPAIAWRPYKQIYTFSKELMDILIAQKDVNMDIPVQVLQNLPFPCAYFDVPFEENLYGFFVHYDIREEGKLYLVMEFVSKLAEDQIGYNGYLELEIKENTTIEDEIKRYSSRIWNSLPSHFSNAYGKGGTPSYQEQTQNALERASIVMQFILYICSDNAEIDPDERNKAVAKPKKAGKIKDAYREVRKNRCGKEFSVNVRKMLSSTKTSYAANPDSHGTPKSPHIRRGHWHHYWTGPRTGERTLILNWIAPTFVHPESDVLPTANIVEVSNKS